MKTHPFLKTMIIALTLQTYGCGLLIGGAAAGAAAGAVISAKQPLTTPVFVETVVANAVYVPAKVTFAGVGAAASGVTYLATSGNSETSRPIWKAAVEGDYVVTPSMIQGGTPVRFIG